MEGGLSRIGVARIASLLIVMGVGCDGPVEVPDPDAGSGMDAGACAGRADGDACGTDGVCMGGACVAALCGNGVTDPSENCDDGNDAAFDGCESDCTFTCSDDSECQDGEACNGLETCNPDSHFCERGAAPEPGSACSTVAVSDGVCGLAEACVAAGCGNGVVDGPEACDDGNDVPGDGCEDDCSFSCTDDSHCGDGVYCNGVETCDLLTHTCQTGEAVVCDASDACHTASCIEEEQRCGESLIDADGDGEAPSHLGGCGTDCDDEDGARAAAHQEICSNLIDDDCDPATMDASTTLYYPDCDGDGFAAAGTTPTSSCMPPASCGDCPCTTRAPTSALNTDCNDGDGDVQPMATERAGDEIDQNCDGRELCFLDDDNDGYRPNAMATIESANLSCGDTREARASEPTTDCNDGAASIRPGVSELPGDEVDQNCDGRETCYADADRDGYRASTATVTSTDLSCSAAGEARSSVAIDCNDNDERFRPNQTAWFDAAVGGSWDYNCNGDADREVTCTGVSPTAGCSRCLLSICRDPSDCPCRTGGLYGGWTGTSLPACGASATYSECVGDFASCSRRSSTRRQRCR